MPPSSSPSSDLFARIGRPDEAARALVFAGGAQSQAGHHETSLMSFAAADAYLNEVAARDGRLGDELSELLLRLEGLWLETLCGLAGVAQLQACRVENTQKNEICELRVSTAEIDMFPVWSSLGGIPATATTTASTKHRVSPRWDDCGRRSVSLPRSRWMG